MNFKLAENEYIAEAYQVIVVGGGHAGCEAAAAAARMGVNTLLLTLNPESIALLPCNPSIGGAAKSVLVREIDAMGGIMARLADESQIQIRMLNTGKGPAVQALRAQIDKPYYSRRMHRLLESTPNLSLRAGEGARLIIENNKVCGVATAVGAVFACDAVILTCGTYLNGLIHIGGYSHRSGPSGYPAAPLMGDYLRSLGLQMSRFKTGTPARVDKNTVDFDKTEVQPGSKEFLAFSYLTKEETFRSRPSVPCYLSYTNERTHQIIRDNLHRSPLYSGRIEGIGPRYCPSLEDKVVRFADRTSHQLFLEPEGLNSREIYVQGMSSSLPEEVQAAFMHTIPGLERVKIIRPAYAIEYDCLQPTQLKATLEHKEIAGFFSAGQLNGTSGYEEAAAQGLLAGVNAAAHLLNKEQLTFTRADSYIGVMVDDLVTKGVIEPYRLFTSLAEYRLLLRQDNADARLTEIADSYGLIDEERRRAYYEKKEAIAKESQRLRDYRLNGKALQALGIDAKGGTAIAELLRRPEIDYEQILKHFPSEAPLPLQVKESVEIAFKYEGYINKQLKQVERFKNLEKKKLSAELDYLMIKGLSNESAQKLARFKPDNIGQASRITGVSPADINVLLIYIEQHRRMFPVKQGDKQ